MGVGFREGKQPRKKNTRTEKKEKSGQKNKNKNKPQHFKLDGKWSGHPVDNYRVMQTSDL